MADLLPCPFCGSTNLRYEFAGSQGYIECNECGTEGPCDERAADPYCDDDAACDAWNRRAALTEPIAGPVGGNYREAWDMSSKDGSLCFASAILSRLVGGVLDEADVRWLAAYLQANSTPQPVAVSDDLRHLVRFMCQTWVEIDQWGLTVGADALDSYPVIQGSRNQMNLRQIAAQPCDSERVAIGVQLMLSPEVIVQPLPITPPAGQEVADVHL